MKRDLDALTVNEIMEEYGYGRQYIYTLLRREDSPITTGRKGKQYHILRVDWETWLRQIGHKKTA